MSRLIPLAVAAALALAGCDQPKPAGPPVDTAPATTPPKPRKVRVIPAIEGPTPAAPAWAAGMIGKQLRDVFPRTNICRGNADIIQQTYVGPPAGVQVHGWGWDEAKKARVERVILVDAALTIVGAGSGGVPRPDVLKVLPDLGDGNTGWNADAPLTHGPLDAYGVVADGRAICPLARIEF